MLSLIFTVLLLLVMVFIFVFDGDMNKIKILKNKPKDKETENTKNTKSTVKKGNVFSPQDKLNFKIKSIGDGNDPALIVKDNGSYVGVVEIYGVNINLLSIDERLLIEKANQEMLNGFDYPIEIFTQSRRVDIEHYKLIYNKRLDELKEKLKQKKNKYNLLLNSSSVNDLNSIKEVSLSISRLENQISYGDKVIKFIEGIIGHSEILENRYYIAIPYTYTGSIDDEEEKFITAYNTISNRANSIISAFHRGNTRNYKDVGKMLNGYELAELLYTAYNKKNSEKYKFSKALKSEFNNFIVTARPVEYKILEQKEKELKEIINR